MEKTVEETVLEMLSEVGGIVFDSHVNYGHEIHGETYVSAERLFPHLKKMNYIGREIARVFSGNNIEAVVGILDDSAILSAMVAYHLTRFAEREVINIYANRPMGAEHFRFRQYPRSIISGKRVLVVKAILTSGFAANRLIKATRMTGGEIVGLGAICNLCGVTSRDIENAGGISISSLVNVRITKWDKPNCPLCIRGVPINPDAGVGDTSKKNVAS